MAGRYGMSFAKELIERGEYEEAIASATQEITEGAEGPEPFLDRATAHELEESYSAAALDFEEAIRRNLAQKVLDPFVLDDAYFSALVAWANHDRSEAPSLMPRYRATLPEGAHVSESREWEKRLRGELPSLLDKTRGVAG
ncbi:MAG: hypothetical protein IPK71_22300 [Myxococcales bacterium]|jgi:hypothetical protein|nr:hypothetical protein [Myxococcales bacterium]MBL9113109.1 hypothetical protein [Myxococcales bacterium]